MPSYHAYSRISSRAEQEFRRQLTALDNSWHVFPSVTFESLDKTGHIYARGEIDAVVYHREYGFVAIEVKAGSWRSHDGHWKHRPRGSEDWFPDNDPFEQAQRGFFWLQNELRRASKGHGRPKVAWALAVPDVDRDDCTIPDARKRFLLDRNFVRDPERRLRAILDVDGSFEHQPAANLDEEQRWFEAIRPTIELFEASEAALDRSHLEVGFASREIDLLARALRSQHRVRVEGPPGSGKTVLALSWLEHRRDALRGYLCFNAPLAAWIGESSAAKHGQIDVHTFHDLGRLLIEAAELEAWPQEPDPGFWRDGFLPLLDRSITALESRGLLERYDALAIDEAQDFDPSWWPLLERILSPDGSMGVFLDPLQDLRRTGACLPDIFQAVDPIHLDAVRRVPVRVQEWIATQLDESWEAHHDLDADGGSVEEIAWADHAELHKRLQDVLNQLTEIEGITPERILISSLRSREQCPWSDGLKQARWVRERGFAPRRHVRMDTTMRTKGLEADVVIIPDLDREAADFASKLLPRLRVAASRTTGRLFVLASPPSRCISVRL